MPQFTKAAIIKSFSKLLDQKSFEKITVKDIVEDCGVNRKTFYYYFADIYDLLEQVFRQEISEFVESEAENMTLEESIIGIFEKIENRKKAVYHLYTSSDKDEVQRYLIGVLNDLLLDKIKAVCASKGIAESDAVLLCGVFVLTFSGMIFGWIGGGMKPDYHHVIKRVCVMLRGSVELMLDNLKKYDSQK